MSNSIAEARPRLAPGFRLQWEAAQGAFVLLFPEGMVRLNTSAAEILRRCDGGRTLEEIATEIEQAFQRGGLQGEINAFLEHALSRGWVQCGTRDD